jgi:hypothetical protein
MMTYFQKEAWARTAHVARAGQSIHVIGIHTGTDIDIHIGSYIAVGKFAGSTTRYFFAESHRLNGFFYWAHPASPLSKMTKCLKIQR